MILPRDEIKTKVWLLPYEKSSIDENAYIPTSTKSITVSSVKNYEDRLVEITSPGGQTVVANAAQLITAIQKCIR